MPRRVVAKVEWHPGELYLRVGFIVTNLSRPVERVVAFYNKRGTGEHWIKKGKNANKRPRLSCCSFAANAVRLQVHALAYNIANFMRTLALPEAVAQWSLTNLREKLVKIGAKVVRHARYAIFQMAEVAVAFPSRPRKSCFAESLSMPAWASDGEGPRPSRWLTQVLARAILSQITPLYAGSGQHRCRHRVVSTAASGLSCEI